MDVVHLALLGHLGTDAKVAALRRWTTIEDRVHRLALQLEGDLDGAFPIAYGCLALVLERARPAIGDEHRRKLDLGLAERLFEGGDALLVRARSEIFGDELVARAHFEVLVTELRRHAWDLGNREVGVHQRIESDLHTPSNTVSVSQIRR